MSDFKLTGDPVIDEALKFGGKVTQLNPQEPPQPQKRPLRVFWHSNTSWSKSGYGNQTREITPRIRKYDQIDIACGDFFGLEGGIIGGYIPSGITDPQDIEASFATIPQYPKMGDVWGIDMMIYHAKDWNADCVISLQDSWVLDMNGLTQVKNYIPYVPIDHNPLPEAIKMRLRLAYRIISMSKFGERELAKNGFYSTYIPHMVDTKKMVILDKAECRKLLNIPEDIYLVGVVGANKEQPSRKGFEYALRAFKKFHDKHPKSALFFHSFLTQPGGINLQEWSDENHYNVPIYSIPQYQQDFKIGRDQMTKMYNMFDLLLAPSISEGFGIPIIEAQAVGVPVITTDWTSMTELVEEGKTGYAVKVKEKRESPLGSYFGIPDEDDIYDKMEEIFNHPMDRQYIRQRIVDNYDSDLVYEKYWNPFLEKLSEELILETIDNPPSPI